MQNTRTQFWPDIPLGEFAAISTACLYPLENWPNDHLEPITTIEKIVNGVIVLSDTKYVKISERELFKFRLRKGDIVLNNRTSANNIGKSAMIDFDQAVLHTKYLRIRPLPELDSQFLQSVLQSYRAQGKLRQITKTSSNLSIITVSDLNNLRIPCPPLEIQRQLLNSIDSESETEELTYPISRLALNTSHRP